MNTSQRREAIIQVIREKKKVKIIELSTMFDVSRETVRNDLYEIEESNGSIRKVYGGAVLDEITKESAYYTRRKTNETAKKNIAKFATNLIENGDTIYLDYGSTVLNLAEMLANKKDLLVVTNTLPIINVLAEFKDVSIFVPGGIIRRNEFSFEGASALRAIEDIYVDIGFFGCSGINLRSGITNIYEDEVNFSKQMLAQATKSIVLADHSKFGITSYRQVASFSEIDMIVTDRIPDAQMKETILSENKELKIIETK